MATILRNGRNGPSRPVAYQFDDLAVEAKAYLAQVRAEADQLLAQAQQQVEATKAAAHEEGLREGRAVALRIAQVEAEGRLKEALPALAAATQAVARAQSQWMADWEREAIRLAIAIAGKVVRREVKHDREVAATLVREALATAVGGDSVSMHLHPEDHEALKSAFGEISREFNAFARIEFVADETLERGGCRLQTTHGVMDQSASVQLARIEEELCA